ncbi:hypothetical protein L484_020830 [Morus notabilis]|uniref:Uncharacterized protein n=1 Tax=Morus notabilis TaxID=981085 RepID=W9QP04_9ROSA|nr:hypothetical protein L484_020830 [Morus notabilis]
MVGNQEILQKISNVIIVIVATHHNGNKVAISPQPMATTVATHHNGDIGRDLVATGSRCRRVALTEITIEIPVTIGSRRRRLQSRFLSQQGRSWMGRFWCD